VQTVPRGVQLQKYRASAGLDAARKPAANAAAAIATVKNFRVALIVSLLFVSCRAPCSAMIRRLLVALMPRCYVGNRQSWKGMAPISAVSIAARETGVRPLPPVSVARFGAGRIAPGQRCSADPEASLKARKVSREADPQSVSTGMVTGRLMDRWRSP
jgi:hypothetical protein